METFSTVLFVNHAPVGYTVQRSDDRVVLNPAENPSRSEEPPHLAAEKRAGNWSVRGTDNEELIRQVLEEINRSEDHQVYASLSAAP